MNFKMLCVGLTIYGKLEIEAEVKKTIKRK